jgi:hypothetical protein
MLKTLRILAGALALALILAAGSYAVRDCPVGPFTYENCIWLQVRGFLHLEQSKFLRGLTLEVIGLCLLAGVFLTIRYIFPARRTHASDADPSLVGKAEVVSDPPPSPEQ